MQHCSLFTCSINIISCTIVYQKAIYRKITMIIICYVLKSQPEMKETKSGTRNRAYVM